MPKSFIFYEFLDYDGSNPEIAEFLRDQASAYDKFVKEHGADAPVIRVIVKSAPILKEKATDD